MYDPFSLFIFEQCYKKVVQTCRSDKPSRYLSLSPAAHTASNWGRLSLLFTINPGRTMSPKSALQRAGWTFLGHFSSPSPFGDLREKVVNARRFCGYLIWRRFFASGNFTRKDNTLPVPIYNAEFSQFTAEINLIMFRKFHRTRAPLPSCVILRTKYMHIWSRLNCNTTRRSQSSKALTNERRRRSGNNLNGQFF